MPYKLTINLLNKIQRRPVILAADPATLLAWWWCGRDGGGSRGHSDP